MKKLFFSLFIIFSLLFTVCGKAFAMYLGPSWSSYPIKVYVPSGETYSKSMVNAFTRWQTVSKNKISFDFVSEGNADIIVNFVDFVDGSDGNIGSYYYKVKGGKIVRAEIYIIKNTDRAYSNDLMYTTMLHEIGHVLGLPDSSRKIGIMASPVTEKQDLILNDIVRLLHTNNSAYSQGM